MKSSGRRPTANRWQDKVFRNFRLYAVTDKIQPGEKFLKTVEALYKNGADIIQLRSKTLSIAEQIKLGRAIRKIATRQRKLYFVNDSLDLALLTDADGLHIGQDDLNPKDVRMICRKLARKIYLGLSTHSEAQARAAGKQPVDYFGVGPVFKTPTKPGYQSVGLELVKKVSGFAVKPWVAIGGINLENMNQVLNAGAKRVAVVRAIFDAHDSGKATREFISQLKGN